MEKRIAYFASLFAMATCFFCACGKSETGAAGVPASFEGMWAWTATTEGKSWTDAKVGEILVFSGNGEYSLLEQKDGKGAVSKDGIIQTVEDNYTKNSKTHSCVVNEDEGIYTFSHDNGSYTLLQRRSDSYQFSRSVGGKDITYKFSKIKGFLSAEDIDPDDGKTRIAHSVILEGNDLAGQIRDKNTGKGIEGIVVSDGYTCVKTDANGVYQFKSDKLSRVVFYSTPSEYRIATEENNPSIPAFYRLVTPDGKLQRNDFELEPLTAKETSWTYVGIGDPQCGSESDATRYTTETIPDLKSTLANYSNVYAMTLGDIVYDSTGMWPTMRKSMANVQCGAAYVPFFQSIGNHDHDSLKPDTDDDAMDDYNATDTFVKNYGPTDYSFNRGDVHIVVMDDIIVSSLKDHGQANGKSWVYTSGFTDKQLEWLRQDLAAVDGKAGKMVFLCTHIPCYNSTEAHFQDVLKLLDEFKEVHLMVGHAHYTYNHVYNYGILHTGKGGLPIYEHVHGSACGSFWRGNLSATETGEPSGYTIYEIDGAHIKNWQFKGTRKYIGHQLLVFDGNDTYYENGKYPLCWTTYSQKVNKADVRGNEIAKGCFIAQVFNEDETYWKVEMYDSSTGEKIGDFKHFAAGAITNIPFSAYFYNNMGSTSASYCKTWPCHLWCYKPSSGEPKEQKNWEVRATHNLPGGSAVNVYTCSKFTKEGDLRSEYYF